MEAQELVVTPAAKRWFTNLMKAAGGGIHSERVIITPERAALLLTKNEGNRNIRESKAKQYEADMRDGRFAFNGEPIILSKEGLLNDGQHRLLACVRSGKDIETIITLGVERESRFTIDTGANKGAGDFLAQQGVSNSASAAGISRFVLAWEMDATLNRRSVISASQQIERVKSDSLLRDVAGWVDAQRFRLKNMMKPAIAGALYYLLAQKDRARAREFMTGFRDGDNLPRNSPIWLLREKLRTDSRLTDMQKMEMGIRAWNHWCASPLTTMRRLQLMNTIPAIQSPLRAEVLDESQAAE